MINIINANIYDSNGNFEHGMFIEDSILSTPSYFMKSGSFIDESGNMRRVTVIRNGPDIELAPWETVDFNKLF